MSDTLPIFRPSPVTIPMLIGHYVIVNFSQVTMVTFGVLLKLYWLYHLPSCKCVKYIKGNTTQLAILGVLHTTFQPGAWLPRAFDQSAQSAATAGGQVKT